MDNNKTTCKRVALCIPGYDGPMNFHDIFIPPLKEIGCELLICKDGDPVALEADCILLIGVIYLFGRYEKLLTEHKADRPEVFLWQFEPFPMPGLSGPCMQIARKMVESDFRYLSPFMNRLTKTLVPNRHFFRNLYWKHLLRQLNRHLTEPQRKAYSKVALRDIFMTMREGIEAINHYHRDWCDHYICSTPPRVEFLKQMGVPAYYAPMAYDPYWGEPLGRDRDIDVVFMGNLKGNRTKQLQGIQKELSDKGIEVFMAQGYHNKERTELLNRCKIIIDIDRLGWELPIIRLVTSMACGALVLTSWQGNPAPFSSDHVVQRDLVDFPDTIMYYLEHERERLKIVQAAQHFLLGTLTLKNVIETLLIKRHAWDGIPLKDVKETF